MSKPIANPVNQLGKRLRGTDEPTEDDLLELSGVLGECGETLAVVASDLRGKGLDPTTRLKNTGTIIEKLKRESSLKLSKIHDLAGARIVRSMTLDEQDAIVRMIKEIWPDAKVKDRRELPSHGYRAVHVIVEIDGRFVEVQVRTHYQDIWAQMMESFGDRWGRAVRYGGDPDEPSRLVSEGSSFTRKMLIDTWKQMSDSFHNLAELENRVAQMKARLPLLDPAEHAALESAINELEAEITQKFNNERDLYEAMSGSSG